MTVHEATVRVGITDHISGPLSRILGQSAGLAFRAAEIKHDAALRCPVCDGRGRLSEGWVGPYRWRWCGMCQHLYSPSHRKRYR